MNARNHHAPTRPGRLFRLLAAALVFTFLLSPAELRAAALNAEPLTGDALIESLSPYLTTDAEQVGSYAITKENFLRFYDVDAGDCEVVQRGNGPEIRPKLWLRYTLKPELAEIIDSGRSSVELSVEGKYVLTPIWDIDWETGEITLGDRSSTEMIVNIQNIIIANGSNDAVTTHGGTLKEKCKGTLELRVPLNSWSRGAWRIGGGKIKAAISPLTKEDCAEGYMWLPQLQDLKITEAQGVLVLKKTRPAVPDAGAAEPLTGDALVESLDRYLKTDDWHYQYYELTMENFFEFYDADIGDCEVVRGRYGSVIRPKLWVRYTLKPEVAERIAAYPSYVLFSIRGSYMLTPILDADWKSGTLTLSDESSADGITLIHNLFIANGQGETAAKYDGALRENAEGVLEIEVPLNRWSEGAWRLGGGMIEGPISPLTKEKFAGGHLWLPQLQKLRFETLMGCLVLKNPNDVGYTVLEDGTAAVHSYLGEKEDFELPGTVDGLRVSGITGSGFNSCSLLKTVRIPEGVSFIGPWAFEDCVNLKKIVFPDSCTDLGYAAFYGCVSLREVVLPKTLQDLPDHTFDFCQGLEEIVLPADLRRIGDRAFLDCVKLRKITIPKGVTEIGEQAFSGCESLKSLDIPDSVTEIGVDAFDGCPKLTLTVGRGSAAERYCVEYGLKYRCRSGS